MKHSITIIGYGFISKLLIKQYHNEFSPIITTTKSSTSSSFETISHHYDIYSNLPISIPSTDYCIITIPFSRSLSDPTAYTRGISQLIDQLPMKSYKRVIFTSSTSIYENANEMVDELSPTSSNKRAKALFETEQLILSKSNQSFILRVSGICGYHRNSIQKIKQTSIEDSNLPVNLVHVDDIITIMHHLLTSDLPKESDIINVTSSEHPSKKEYYSYLCKLFNIKMPTFSTSNQPYKMVSNKKLITKYNINLSFKSPLSFNFQE